jgi:hypothetical protein
MPRNVPSEACTIITSKCCCNPQTDYIREHKNNKEWAFHFSWLYIIEIRYSSRNQTVALLLTLFKEVECYEDVTDI